MQRNNRIGRSSGFTLVELLIVIIVIAVLAAIAIPRFINSSARSKEASLHSDLKLVRDAIERFHSDTSVFPPSLDALSSTIAPSTGLDATGASVGINAPDFHGPYVASVPLDPVSASGLNYSVTAGSVGAVSSSASGTDSSGIPFSSY
ncbi:MAG TPA: prepilin-type N-terminal cleavage/methylation domain-containing protein [Fimbriimonadaceae bacterium]|nr:prepilin-type N-terminal cleavage/methylation domain-containing protein [Fimbriimonadaceae bacterium]